MAGNRLSSDSWQSESSSSSRSSSVTPVPKHARGPESDQLARRCPEMVSAAAAMDHNMDLKEEQNLWTPNISPPPASSDFVHFKRELEPSVFFRPDEIIEECGMDALEGESAIEDHLDHVSKWVVQLQQGASERMGPSRSMPEQAGNLVDLPSVTVSDQAAQSRPGTSGDHGSARTFAERVDASASGSGTTAASHQRHAAEPDDEGSDLDSDYDDEYDLDEITAPRNSMRKIIPDDDELDPHVRNMVHSVEKEMDAAVERLVGKSSGFDWQEDFDTFRGVQETFSGPLPGPVKDYDTPYEVFCDIWDEGIIELMVRETNKYARQTIGALREKGKLAAHSRMHRWFDTDANEIRVLIAIYILMGIDQRESQLEYWKTSGRLQLPYLRSLMTFNRFILLNKFLHFADNSDVSQNLPQVGGKMLSAKLRQIAPVVSHLNSKFQSLYNLEEDIVIDESLTLYKGRLSWVEAIRSKAARLGTKSFELCEARSGYLYSFDISTGKNSGDAVSPSADLAGKSAQAVLDLLKGLANRGHCVTMDNYYNSPALARHLKTLGFDCFGTLRANRKNVPEKIKNLPKNVERGKIIALHSGDLACISWQDTKMVNMISTYHDPQTVLSRKAVVKPLVVLDYYDIMGSVDFSYQKLSKYLLERKRCLKWYMKIYKRLLNASVHNAYLLVNLSRERRNLSMITHRLFREELAESLVKVHYQSPAELSVAIHEREVRLTRDIMHVPGTVTSDSRKRCRVCYRQDISKYVKTKCVTCDEFLCFESCWSDWHSLRQLPGKEKQVRQRRRN